MIDVLEIERKWQKYWDSCQTFKTEFTPNKKKLYILDMFPYPSGAGLHVGHPEGYTATDILTRYYRMNGYNVLHPMGWDAFGLPAEQHAMKTNIHPSATTEQSISNFRRQIKMLGLSYDWNREVNTTDPDYYKWTQWIFIQIYNSWYDPRTKKASPISSLSEEFEKNGTDHIASVKSFSSSEWRSFTQNEKQSILAEHRLAYVAEVPVNWCEQLGTVLANEEVPEWIEKGFVVERRPLRQWMMRITAYAQRLLDDINLLDWPNSTLEQQKNWIGRSEGAEIEFKIVGIDQSIKVYTTRPDTLFGATYMVLAPEHPLVDILTAPKNHSAVQEYTKKSSIKSELDRGMEKEKTGTSLGTSAINPATGKPIPIWIADYVMMGYGTGAIMAVPAHDQRDFEFASKYSLPVLRVVEGGGIEQEAYEGEGKVVNSSGPEVQIDGLDTAAAKEKMIEWLERTGRGRKATRFKIRDWLFSRQRYWGEPIPIIYWEDGTISTVPEQELPLLLPPLEKFQPSGTTESPLILAQDWVHVDDPKSGKKGRRETNTMPQWAGSCWYYIRYLDPKNNTTFCDKEKSDYWLPIDLYMGGAEHAVLHLIYSRFWHKILFDLGHLSTPEPFIKLRHQGIILGEDGSKMSKSKNNVVNPDDVVREYGADAFRLFEMFMGPLEEMKPWSTKGVEGVYRFRNRVWRLYLTEDGSVNPAFTDTPAVNEDFERVYHQTVKKVRHDIENLRFNTAISQLMIFINEAYKQTTLPRSLMKNFVLLIAPFMPHIAEELWNRMGEQDTLTYCTYPTYDESKLREERLEIAIQVNGKVRGKVLVRQGASEDEVKESAIAQESINKFLRDKHIQKIIYVKDRLLSFVVT